MRILFLVPWPTLAASTRLRVAQYFPYLRDQGIEPILRPFMSERFYSFVYKPGGVARKTLHFMAACARRMADVVHASRADLVVIHREAFPLGTVLVERAIAAMGVPLVFDFDDAIYLSHGSRANGLVGRLKRPEKVGEILALSRAVVAGNSQLGTYSRAFNPNVAVIPTPVDTRRFRPRPRPGGAQQRRVVVGWIGSATTAQYLGQIKEPLRRLIADHPGVEVHVVGGRDPSIRDLPVRYVDWSLRSEVEQLLQFDVGVMPYPDDEWARGKCAHKSLLYMAVGIPAVCSPVGMASEIIDDGETGFLAASPDEWYAKLAMLVESAELRQAVGARGRALVEGQYDVSVLAPRLVSVFQAAVRGEPLPNPVRHSPVSG